MVRRMLDPSREIYANAPLMLVAFELRFTPIPGLESAKWEQIYDAIRDTFPIVGPPPRISLQFSPGGAEQKTQGVRLLDRGRTRSAVFYEDAAVVETSQYGRFEDLRELIELVLRSLDQAGPIPAVQRVGLRYIDEIAVPDGDPDWRRYIDHSLLCPVDMFEEFSAKAYSGSLELDAGERQKVNVNYGIFSEPVVNPQGALQIPESPEGEYFLIDLDSFWVPPESQFLEFQLEHVLKKCEELHDPIRTIFERSITDDLRGVMRGENE